MSTSSVSRPAAPPPEAVSLARIKWIPLLIAALIGLGIAYAPTPAGLTHKAQVVLAILAFTVVVWATDVMNNGVASILMMAMMIASGVRPLGVVNGTVTGAFSGFADPAFWILLTVLYYGFAMKKTGLAERISYYILSLFPGTYTGILSAFFVIGLLLAMGIPSMTVRTAIMAPIAWALVQSLDLPPLSRGTGLIMITVVEMAVCPGLAFELGSLNGPVVIKMFGAAHVPISQGSYAQVMTLPTLVLCALIVILNLTLFKPEKPLHASREFARTRLAALGSFKQLEVITAIVVGISIVLWVATKLPSFMVGMFGLAVLTLAGVLRDIDIPNGVSWTLMLFLGGIFGLQNVIPEYKITDWMAGLMVPHVQAMVATPILLLVVLSLVMLALRFLDPTAFIALPLVFLPLVQPLAKSGISPMILSAPLLLCSAPFWLPYTNFWIAMTEGITQRQGFTRGQVFGFATIYAFSAIVACVVGYFYWKIIGII
ncbi:MAG TPA: SLC13 family permease [Bryobacteraceae bacterium]|jgi:anion transporter|nr:SLC13 family permease [Bryobacteraceae bacterium]